jgi:hypothetical protein
VAQALFATSLHDQYVEYSSVSSTTWWSPLLDSTPPFGSSNHGSASHSPPTVRHIYVLLKSSKDIIRSWVPTGPDTKNGCAGEDQQQITALLRVVTESPNPPLAEEAASFQNTGKSWKEQTYDHGPRRGLKRRMTVLAKASSKLLQCTKYTIPEDGNNDACRNVGMPSNILRGVFPKAEVMH